MIWVCQQAAKSRFDQNESIACDPNCNAIFSSEVQRKSLVQCVKIDLIESFKNGSRV